MREQTITRSGWGEPTGKVILKFLLLCGIASSVVYVATDVLAALSWPAYDYTAQSVSQLLAIGTPTRSFVFPLMSAYNALVVAFGVGVFASAGSTRSLRVTGILLVVYGIVSHMGLTLFPLRLGETEASDNAGAHIAITAAIVLSMLLFIAVGAIARGRIFRVYSGLTIMAIIVGGALTGMQVETLAAEGSSPWLGVVERVNIYSMMLWVAVFSIALLRGGKDRGPTTTAEAARSGGTKKVTAFVGSPHKGGATYAAARGLLDELESFGDVRGEIVTLSDYDIGVCRGCKVCFDRGEERCPLKDDRDVLIEKMMTSDGVIFASPNYSFQVSGVMKVFLDRLGFLFHRPRFHGRTATAIVVQGIGGGGSIRKYLQFVAGGLGFNVVKGSVIGTLEPTTAEAQRKMGNALAEQSRRFHADLLLPAHRAPSLLQLMVFRMGRTGIELSGRDLDRGYWRDRGWFEAGYFYPVHLSPFKRAAGAFFDWAGARVSTFQVADSPASSKRRSKPVLR